MRGYLLPIDRFQTKTIITIMWVGNLLPFDRFQRKKIITIMWKGNLLPFDRFQTKKIITIMWDGNLLPFDRFQTKKLLQLCERAIYYLLTDSRQKKIIVRGQFSMWDSRQFTTRGQILTDSRQKNYNYNYDRFPRGNLLPFDRFQTKTIITIMWEGNLLPFDRFQK